MHFNQVDIADLSDITYQAYVSEMPEDEEDILIIKYKGAYKDGSDGIDDARYMVATCYLCINAWAGTLIILDFSELEYRWGDAMDHITSITYDRDLRINAPMAIIVGDRCWHGLSSLLEDEFDTVCAFSQEQAIELVRKQSVEYRRVIQREVEADVARWRAKMVAEDEDGAASTSL